MALNGIDISSYQAKLNLASIAYDFVMIKATEGINYINPYCDAQFQRAKAQGKKVAVYHYANGYGAVAEANWFVDNCAGYIRQAIFVLDWEGTGVEFVDWACQFWDQVKARIGYNPAIYMSEYVINNYNWQPLVDRGCGLIAAKYSDYEIDNNYDMSNAGVPPDVKWWPFYFMWQWTSKGALSGYAGDLDCDIFYGNGGTWDSYAGVVPPPPPPSPPTPPLPPSPVPVAPGTIVLPSSPVTPVSVSPPASTASVPNAPVDSVVPPAPTVGSGSLVAPVDSTPAVVPVTVVEPPAAPRLPTRDSATGRSIASVIQSALATVVTLAVSFFVAPGAAEAVAHYAPLLLPILPLLTGVATYVNNASRPEVANY